jgi:hypothetical protein
LIQPRLGSKKRERGAILQTQRNRMGRGYRNSILLIQTKILKELFKKKLYLKTKK